MLRMGDFTGELSEALGEIRMEWKIGSFYTLSQESGYSYQSPYFSFANSTWFLQIFPGGDNIQSETTKWLSLYLKTLGPMGLPNSVNYTFGMKTSSNTTETILDQSHTFEINNSVSGKQKAFQRSEILRRKSELTPSDVLTIICTLKHTTAKTVVATTHPMKLIELESLSTDFKDLLTSKRSCDATVKVKDKEFQVHKSVLIARSSVFSSMFEHDMSEKKTGVISIADCDPDSFGDFLHYLYTGKAENISPRSALHLYSTADKYDVKELKSFCVEFMMRNLMVDNVCDVVTLGEQYDETELVSAAQMFFNKNVGRILSSVKWETLLQVNYRLANKLLREMATKIKIED